MFKNLFKRGKAASEETTKPPVADMAAPDTVPAPLEHASRSTLESFKERWEEKWEPHDPLPSPEVVEGNGGNTDWGLWTEAVKGSNKYPVGVYTLPKHLDEKVARLQLKTLNAQLSELTDEQAAYISVPKEGPYKTEHYRY